MSTRITFGILTVSDSCAAGQAIDKSGPSLQNLLTIGSLVPNAKVIASVCVPDNIESIKQALLLWCKMSINVVLTTGGTGFSPRDVTPEATRLVLEKETPGISLAMMKYSLEVAYPHAMLSRAVSGICGKTLLINLPGSPKAAQECLKAVSPCIPHAVAVICNDLSEVKLSHSKLQVEEISNEPMVNQEQSMPHHNCHHTKSCSKVNTTNVAGRPRKSPYPMIEVSDAQKRVLDASDVLEVETLYFRKALGRVLAEDVFANDPLPPFPASIKDGYAVIAADGAGERFVLGSSAAGELPCGGPLKSGECVRITTGAPVPPGADSVVQVEDTVLVQASADKNEECVVKIEKIPSVGEDIRPVGSDIKSGQLVLSAGSILGAPELGLLATIGVTSVSVHRLPIVALLSTGNELQDPKEGEVLRPGHIRDSNKTTLMALLQQHGFPTVDMGIAIDEPQQLLTALEKSLAIADVIVTTGGVSMGERDLLKSILTTDIGADIYFGRINMKPGKPTTFATCKYSGQKRLIFGLPGNPVSAFVTSHLFVLPALRAMSGHRNPMPCIIKATTTTNIPLDMRPEYYRASLRWDRGVTIPFATGTDNQISCRLLSCYPSNCFLILPASTESQPYLPKGSLVDAMLLSVL